MYTAQVEVEGHECGFVCFKLGVLIGNPGEVVSEKLPHLIGVQRAWEKNCAWGILDVTWEGNMKSCRWSSHADGVP